MDVPVLKGTVASTESFQYHTDFKVFLFLSTPDTLVSLLPFKFPRHISPLKLKLFICLECFSLLANLLHNLFSKPSYLVLCLNKVELLSMIVPLFLCTSFCLLLFSVIYVSIMLIVWYLSFSHQNINLSRVRVFNYFVYILRYISSTEQCPGA